MYDLFSFNEISSKPVIINTSHVIPDAWGRRGEGREERGGRRGEGRGGEGGIKREKVIMGTRQQNESK